MPRVIPANTLESKCRLNVCPHCLRHCPNIKSTLAQRLVFSRCTHNVAHVDINSINRALLPESNCVLAEDCTHIYQHLSIVAESLLVINYIHLLKTSSWWFQHTRAERQTLLVPVKFLWLMTYFCLSSMWL